MNTRIKLKGKKEIKIQNHIEGCVCGVTIRMAITTIGLLFKILKILENYLGSQNNKGLLI